VKVTKYKLPWEIQPGRGGRVGVEWDPERSREREGGVLNARGCLSNGCGWRKRSMGSRD
jgi:hypothetical protein